MSSNEIQKMLQLNHHIDDLRSALDSTVQTPQNDQVLREKIDFLVNEAKMDIHVLYSRIMHWREVNRVTTESGSFEENCKFALEYLTNHFLTKEAE